MELKGCVPFNWRVGRGEHYRVDVAIRQYFLVARAQLQPAFVAIVRDFVG